MEIITQHCINNFFTPVENPRFEKKAPCANCPYRKDAPRQLWSIEEFKDLLKSDASPLGSVYGCHKADGHGGLPSINLRISLMRGEVTREYLDSLTSPAPMFSSIEEMCIANYPELKK